MSQANLIAKLDALAAMSPAQLCQEWNALSGEELPNILTRHLIAYRVQEKQHGKLPMQIERQLDKLTDSRRVEVQDADAFDIAGSTESRAPNHHCRRHAQDFSAFEVSP